MSQLNFSAIDRRRFLALAGLAGASLLLPRALWAADAQVASGKKAEVAFGMCGSMGKAKMLKDAGCEYIEEGVGQAK